MHTGLVTLLIAIGAWNVWTEPSWVRVGLDSQRSEHASGKVSLTAVRGERESVQVCVRSSKPVKGLQIKAESLADGMPSPDVRLVGVAGLRSETGVMAVPDPLLESRTVDLQADKTLSFWVTYHVPPEAKRGTHKGRIEVFDADNRRERLKVRLDVRNFAIPERPTFRAWFPMDRNAVEATSRWNATSLEQWRSLYDSLGRHRVSFGLWYGDDLAQVAKTGSCDTAPLKEHITYAVEKCRVNAIGVLPSSLGTAVFPQPVRASGYDSLQAYLHDMGNWLEEKGWISHAIAPLTVPEDRSGWGGARREFLRVKRVDKRFKRLVIGPLHSDFERYAEIWSFPTDDWSPYAVNSLLTGRSLFEKPRFAPDRVEASSNGVWPPQQDGTPSFTSPVSTLPEDACDASPFTAWICGKAPVQGEREWVEVVYKEPITTNRLAVIWKTGFECVAPKVQVSMDGHVYSAVSLRWSPRPAPDAFTDTWAEAEFRMDRTFKHLRIEFPYDSSRGLVAVSEIIAGGIESVRPMDEPVPVVEPWLQAGKHPATSFELGAEPLRYRAAPWNCRELGAAGLVGPNLTGWPEAWRKPGGATGPECTLEESRSFLLYPGVETPLPSVRMELLRDGLEDYECLKMLEKVSASGVVTKKRTLKRIQRLLALDPGHVLADPEVQGKFARGIPERREQILSLLDWIITQYPEWEKRIPAKPAEKEKQ